MRERQAVRVVSIGAHVVELLALYRRQIAIKIDHLHHVDHVPVTTCDMMRRICEVQLQLRKHVLGDADRSAPTRKHDLGRADHRPGVYSMCLLDVRI